MTVVSYIKESKVDFTASRYVKKGEFGKYRKKTPQYLWSFFSWPIKTLGMSFLRDKIYHASSNAFKRKINEKRVQESKDILTLIGGKELSIETEDGVVIDAMFFDVDSFRKKIEAFGGIFVSNQDNGITNNLKFSSHNLKQILEKMRVDNIKGILRQHSIKINTVQKNPSITTKPNVMIVTQGNAGIYEMNRRTIGRFLLKGQSVIAFNIRGTGKSSGIPSEDGTYHDVEAIYQYLKHVKGFSPGQINVFGYCLGSGLATELALRHPGIHLYLDRAAAKIPDIMSNVVEKLVLGDEQRTEESLKSFTRKAMRLIIPVFLNNMIISYNNGVKVTKVQGKVFLLHAGRDSVIPSWSADVLQRACHKAQSSITESTVVLDAEIEHCDKWTKRSEDILDEHMECNGESNVRNFPLTIKPDEGIFNFINLKFGLLFSDQGLFRSK